MDIHTVRDRIATVHAALAQLAQASLPLDEAMASMDAFLERLASAYRPPVGYVFGRDAQPSLDVAPLLLGDPRDMHATWMLWAAVQGDSLRTVGHARLRESYETDPALAHPVPLAERAERLEDLQRQLADLELDEERLIVEAELRGEQVDRRGAARPEIVFAEEVLRLEEGLDPAELAG